MNNYSKEIEERWGNTPEYKEFKEKNKEGLENIYLRKGE